ncbi:FAD/FMN-containing dehydrogenase [Azospirillum lipoferum]|uniref:FAD-binding protein n=1 Tax=Azospirillum lipoferum TaxID=193 RepID=A0A5A9G3R6_AZOLI|nr:MULTISPECIES: FAD-binding protein [Azospirillum]KAA0588445.1 FAD-binding protein [Azospirillum lipoferum]MCP1615236.1 FAD/FMN-containing dehydrogenase [Azospirillum lipoferum]MDW5534070.1 FAD-binding protein [Azospirillum sp. NL1]
MSQQPALRGGNLARDFGGMCRAEPAIVRSVSSAEMACAAIAEAQVAGLQVAVRGLGHSCNGQTLAGEGFLLDLSGLVGVDHVGEGYCDVLAGTTWGEVIRGTLPTGQVPAVLPDYLGLTVGGTVSIGGLGGTSFREGMICEQMLWADVIKPDGAMVRCSSDENAELFALVKGGAGQFGVIARLRLKLVDAPAEVDCYHLFYRDAEAMVADQLALLDVAGLWHLGGWILPLPHGWTPCIEAVVPAGSKAIDKASPALSALPTTKVDRLSLDQFLRRLELNPAFPCDRGNDAHAHPWATAFIPAANAARYAAELMSSFPADQMGPAGVIELYPVPVSRLGQMGRRWGGQGVAYIASAFPCQTDTSTAALAASEARNRRLFDLALELDGLGDPQAGALRLSADDWRRQLGPAIGSLQAARHHHDPENRFKPLHGLDGITGADRDASAPKEDA